MAEITASMVKDLRELTGLGMMECKKALVEADKQRLAETMNQLAESYHKYEQDWARSAFWRRST
jgi:translation elongation factor EF-Ts